jgi:propionyl-CoA synthetase
MGFCIARDAARTATPETRLAFEGELMKTVEQQLGAVARPARVFFVNALPKTRSGKLLRRAIQAVAEGRDPGDLTTIEDPTALEQLLSALKG